MILTKKASWMLHSELRGVPIYKRVGGTGTACGNWLTPGTYHNSLVAAKNYINSLPIGQFVGMTKDGQKIITK